MGKNNICNTNYDDLTLSMLKAIDNIREADSDYNSKRFDKRGDEIIRDHFVTILFKKYIEKYQNKVDSDKTYKKIIFWASGVLLLAFLVLIYIIAIGLLQKGTATIHLATALTAIASISGCIFGIINTIVKYVFPVKEEKYITDIVKSIQHNDYKHLKVRSKGNSKTIGDTKSYRDEKL